MDTQPASHPSHHDQQEQQNQDTDGNTPLHHACLHSAILEIHTLLANGERWNALNGDNKTPAEMTEDGEVRKIMKEEGIRSEMVLRMMMGLDVSSDEEETQEEEEKEEEKEDEDAEVQDISKAINKTQEESAATEKMDTDADTGSQAEHIQERLAPEATGPTVNEEDLLTGCVGASAAAKSDRDGQTEYLKEQVSYDEVTGNLLDNDKNGVMMQWEDLIMQLHAQVICETNGSTAKHKTILNVGFGMGIIDTYIQEHCPRYHYIIEAHPQVYAKMLTDGWDKKGGVKIYFGTWQEVVPKLIAEKVQFDGIFWDTFGETYERGLLKFHRRLKHLLHPQGVYSFFNGLGATQPFFHDVYCDIAELDLNSLGFSCSYQQVSVDSGDTESWQGIKRRYFSLSEYNLPVVTWKDMDAMVEV